MRRLAGLGRYCRRGTTWSLLNDYLVSLSLSLCVCVFVSVFSKPGAKMQWIELEGTLLVTTSTNENGPTVRQNKRKHFYLCFRTFF